MRKLKVMLVDDEEDFVSVMVPRVAGWGYDVFSVPGGKEALSALAAEKPDMIILDYMMPDMDGIEALKKIREVNKDIPVVMFTAYPDARAIDKASRLNVSAFIPKLSKYSDTQSSLKTSLDMARKSIEKKDRKSVV